MRISLEVAEQKVPTLDNVFWNGYDIVIFDPKIDGYMNNNGIFYNGVWGVSYIIYLSENGDWVIPKKYERFFK
jgi:hypothetical protein